MSTILLPIKPVYVRKILEGSKKYEFRRSVAKRKVDRILIYSTAPEMKVVAIVEVLGVMKDSPRKLWEKTRAHAGISRPKFMDYYVNRSVAYAYQLGELQKFDTPDSCRIRHYCCSTAVCVYRRVNILSTNFKVVESDHFFNPRIFSSMLTIMTKKDKLWGNYDS